MTRSHPESPDLQTLDAARDALARAREVATNIDPRVLARFEKKLRMTEGALAPASPPERGAATSDGLRTVLARVEASARGHGPSADQARALALLRGEVERRARESLPGKADATSLLDSLAADTARLKALATPPAAMPAAASATESKKGATSKKGVTASKSDARRKAPHKKKEKNEKKNKKKNEKK